LSKTIAPLSNVPGPENITSFILPNGIRVFSFHNPNVRSMVLIGILGGGARLDTADRVGLAHFTANSLSRGTRDYNFQAFHHQLESIGANLSFGCGTQHAWMNAKSLREDADTVFYLAAQGLRFPRFEEKYINRLRAQLLAGLAIRDQDTEERASMRFDQMLYQGHPYGFPVDGFTETIQAINSAEIIHFHHRHYHPEQLTMVVAGAVLPQRVKQLTEKYFADWEASRQPDAPIPPLPQPPTQLLQEHTTLAGKSQADLVMGTFGPARMDADFLPAYLGNHILGQFGLMGRIGKIVRSQSGLAYYASSSISAWADVGAWSFSAGVNPANKDKVVNLIRTQIAEFITNPVTKEELTNSASHLIGRMPMSLESNEGIANAILRMVRFDLGLDYYQNYASIIQSITAKDILVAAKKYLNPDMLLISSAGP